MILCTRKMRSLLHVPLLLSSYALCMWWWKAKIKSSMCLPSLLEMMSSISDSVFLCPLPQVHLYFYYIWVIWLYNSFLFVCGGPIDVGILKGFTVERFEAHFPLRTERQTKPNWVIFSCVQAFFSYNNGWVWQFFSGKNNPLAARRTL